MLKIRLLLVLALFTFSKFYCQDTIYVYHTYQNYLDNTGQHYDKMLGFSGNLKMNIIVSKNAVETTIKCKNIWGFSYNRRLFRTDERTGQVAMLMVKGKICYYENGMGHLKMIRDKSEKEDFYLGYYCYVSKDLQSKMAPFPDPQATMSDANKQLRRFKKENPEYTPFFAMLSKPYYYSDVRLASIAFNKTIRLQIR